MKKILLITQNFYPEIGSGANRMKNLYKQLKMQGDEVIVLTTNPSYPNEKLYLDDKYWDDAFINAHGEDIVRLRMQSEKQKSSIASRMMYYLEFMIKVHYFVRKMQDHFDIIYVTSPNIFGPWGTLFAQKKSAQRILEIRDLWPDSVEAIDKMNIKYFMPMLRSLEKAMYEKADKIVVNNAGFIQHINKEAPSKEILFIPNAMYEGEIAFRPRRKDFSVVYTGNLGYAQSYEDLKYLADGLEAAGIHFNIVAYGVHSYEFKSYIESKRYQFVTVHTAMPRHECLSLVTEHHLSVSVLKDTDVLLNVLPGKVVDSICAHVPVITNLGGFVEEMVKEYNVGYAKESAEPKALLDAIIDYRDNTEKWQLAQQNTKKLAEEKFLWEKNILKLNDFMR